MEGAIGMLRLATLFWILLVSAAAGGMYAVKYRVQGIEHILVKTEKATIAEQREIRVLDAEWTYLNRPEALAQMNTRFLSLVPITAKELRTSVADIPMRTSPDEGTPQGKIVTVAAVSAPASPQPQIIPAVPRDGPTDQAAPRDRPLSARTMARSRMPRRNKSLDDLIARIVASR
jgi:hypothetical protein